MSRQSKKPRSQVIQEALRLWRRKEFHAKLAEGYRSMADEDRETAERNLIVSSVCAPANNESTNNQ